eukprot:tig00000492_g1560.t1
MPEAGVQTEPTPWTVFGELPRRWPRRTRSPEPTLLSTDEFRRLHPTLRGFYVGEDGYIASVYSSSSSAYANQETEEALKYAKYRDDGAAEHVAMRRNIADGRALRVFRRLASGVVLDLGQWLPTAEEPDAFVFAPA